ncbi:hypothetical protein ACHQM5_021785 [Ranunculus cassubicifolius]
MEPTMVSCSFPDEIMMNILSHLPIKSLVRFRCVCKSWFRLFTGQNSDPYFSQLHDAQLTLANPDPILIDLYNNDEHQSPSTFRFASDYTQIDNPIEIKEPDCCTDESDKYVWVNGICNGLVCFESWESDSNTMYIWNPVTRDNIRIPCPPYLSDKSIKRNKRAVYGFGFCQATYEYKVVGVIVSSLGSATDKYDYQCHANVLTLGTNTWRIMQDVLSDVHTRHWKSCSVIVNGVHHWLSERKSTFRKILISFDLEHEILQEIPLPNNLENHYIRVEELSGMLAIVYEEYKKGVQIWVMKDYGDHNSWRKQFTITQSQIPVQNRILEPFGIANDGNIMMRNWDVLLLFNPKTNSITSRNFFCSGDSLRSTYFYKWSLVSPRYITVLDSITEN